MLTELHPADMGTNPSIMQAQEADTSKTAHVPGKVPLSIQAGPRHTWEKYVDKKCTTA